MDGQQGVHNLVFKPLEFYANFMYVYVHVCVYVCVHFSQREVSLLSLDFKGICKANIMKHCGSVKVERDFRNIWQGAFQHALLKFLCS